MGLVNLNGLKVAVCYKEYSLHHFALTQVLDLIPGVSTPFLIYNLDVQHSL